MNNKDECPTNFPGGHRYFIFKTIEVFKQFFPTTEFIEKHGEAFIELCDQLNPMYQKKEYATLGCNCGSVIRRVVKS